MKSNRFWILILGVLLFLSLVALLVVRFLQQEGDVVEIRQGGEIIHTLPLHTDQSLRIDAANGGYNLVEVKGGQVRVTEASCPDRICIKHGPTSRMADPITCLPNELTVQVILRSGSPLDGVSQ